MKTNSCPALFHSDMPPCTSRRENGSCTVERCGYARMILESIHLIQLGARVGLVGQLTGLEKKTLKRIYRQLMGKPSPSGQLPFSDSWFLENDRRLFHVTLIWHLYRRLNRGDGSHARILIDVFEVYTQFVREPMLNMTRTAFAIQLFITGLWNEHRCAFCGMAFPAPVESNQTSCAGCHLYHRHRCHWCGSSLSPKPRGVRRKTCIHCGGALN